MTGPGLAGHRRRLAIAQVRASQPNCHLCQLPIDQSLDRQRHPLGSVVDEVLPRSHGGSAVDPANLRHAHRLCNGSRGTKPITVAVRVRCRALVVTHLARARRPVRRW